MEMVYLHQRHRISPKQNYPFQCLTVQSNFNSDFSFWILNRSFFILSSRNFSHSTFIYLKLLGMGQTNNPTNTNLENEYILYFFFRPFWKMLNVKQTVRIKRSQGKSFFSRTERTRKLTGSAEELSHPWSFSKWDSVLSGNKVLFFSSGRQDESVSEQRKGWKAPIWKREKKFSMKTQKQAPYNLAGKEGGFTKRL